jgi:peptidoglycan hydrolase-like protein with peptidoglycan-binding domain
MSDLKRIQDLIDEGKVESHLRRGSGHKEDVKVLQRLLFDLGFGAELNWQRYGADGGYGSSTNAAVQAFCLKNGIESPAGFVSVPVAEKILQRFDMIDDLRLLARMVQKNQTDGRLYHGSADQVGIASLQTLLAAAGYGKPLNWKRYGADGKYGRGTVNAVRAFAKDRGTDVDGTNVDRKIARQIIDSLKRYFGDRWEKQEEGAPTATTVLDSLSLREATEAGRKRLYVSDGTTEARFTRHKKGLYFAGKEKTADFIHGNRPALSGLGLTDSAINVMLAVSENEGNLDAVNTWDNAFLSFGMFQWTAGTGISKGELPALVKKIKAANPSVFTTCFGQYGLDVMETGPVYGYFTVNGRKIDSIEYKEMLRSHVWAYRFWRAGLDPAVQAAEVTHALSRLTTFYRSKRVKVNGHPVSDLVTSEYGVALILDNHVNRPGYVIPCLKAAMEHTGLESPESWGNEKERRLIQAYLSVRENYGKHPMTDAVRRAAVTRRYLDRGVVSDARGSFVWP